MAKRTQEEQWRRADEKVRKKVPPGVNLVRTLRGHTRARRIAWSPDGRILASPSDDKTIRLWDAETGGCLRTLKGHKEVVNSLAFDPAGRTLASGKLLRRLRRHANSVCSPVTGNTPEVSRLG